MSSLHKANFTFTFTVIGTISYIQVCRIDLYVISEKVATLNLDIKHSRWYINHKYEFYSITTHRSYMQTFCGDHHQATIQEQERSGLMIVRSQGRN